MITKKSLIAKELFQNQRTWENVVNDYYEIIKKIFLKNL